MSVVDEGGTLTVTGRALTPAGAPVAGRRLTLVARAAGANGWTTVGHATSNGSGDVSFTSRGLLVTTAFRVVARKVAGTQPRSRSLTVKVKPRLTATWSAGTLVVEASANRAGEAVTVRIAGVSTRVTLDATGRATGEVRPTRRERACVVTLPASRRHTGASTTVVVPAAP